MIAIFAVGLALSGRHFDFIDGKALGFTFEENEVIVDCHTDQGVKVVMNHHCFINSDGTWGITVDGGPENVSSYVVRVRPDKCLPKIYKVSVPKTGRPSLKIKRSDFVFGDLNGNDVVDSGDVLSVQDAVGIRKGDLEWTQRSKRIEIAEPAQRFDFNRDGIIDAKDVSMVKVNLGKRASRSA